MANTLIVPPYRAALLNRADGSPMTRPENGDEAPGPVSTERQWYYYWRDVGIQTNANTQKLDLLDGIVAYGLHVDRPAEATTPDGALYVETDRGDTIYQLHAGIWVYLAGTMYGTLSPDQRPAGLGVNDAGFDFRTNGDPAREFLWSGTAWIEVTPTRYGTHAARLATVLAGLVSGMLWIETDRGNVTYQKQGGAWLYVAGTMYGTLSPDQRPTDLAPADINFLFCATDGVATFRWTGGSWIVIAAAPTYQIGNGTTNIVLTTVAQAVPGATLTLTRTGQYVIRAGFDLAIQGTGDLGQQIYGQVQAAGAALPGAYVIVQSPGGAAGLTGVRTTVGAEWIYIAATPGIVIQAVAFKAGGTGTSAAVAAGTWVSATWLSP